MWSAVVASAFGASSASATFAKAKAQRAKHAAAGIRMVGLEVMESTLLDSGAAPELGRVLRLAAAIAANGGRASLGEAVQFLQRRLMAQAHRFAAARMGPAPVVWTRIAAPRPASSVGRLKRSAFPFQPPNRTISRTMFLCGKVLPAFSPCRTSTSSVR